jgi:transposase
VPLLVGGVSSGGWWDVVPRALVLTRAHQTMIWSRTLYPAALVAFDDLTSGDALEVLKVAPTPTQGTGLSRSKIAAALRRGGRQRRIEHRVEEIQQALRAPKLQSSALVATATGSSVLATVAVIATMNAQVAELAQELEAHFEQHPDAEVVRSLPGLGTILSAGVLGEFGDEPNRYGHPPRLSRQAHYLLREHCLGPSGRTRAHACRLTVATVGYLTVHFRRDPFITAGPQGGVGDW